MQQDVYEAVPGMTIDGVYLIGLLIFSVLVVHYLRKGIRK
jgi:hypothetical protein